MPVPPNNGRSPEPQRPPDSPNGGGGLNDLIAEAELLRTILGDASARTARLVAALKQQRRQSRAVQQAMQSLRQLQIDR